MVRIFPRGIDDMNSCACKCKYAAFIFQGEASKAFFLVYESICIESKISEGFQRGETMYVGVMEIVRYVIIRQINWSCWSCKLYLHKRKRGRRRRSDWTLGKLLDSIGRGLIFSWRYNIQGRPHYRFMRNSPQKFGSLCYPLFVTSHQFWCISNRKKLRKIYARHLCYLLYSYSCQPIRNTASGISAIRRIHRRKWAFLNLKSLNFLNQQFPV